VGEITYTDHVRDNVGSQASNPEAARLKVYCLTLCDLLDRSTVEVDRLRAENAALADPAVVVAMWLTGRSHPAEEYLARMRDMFPPDALEAAAAKVQEAEG
jgi:hypothetical protein